jgi:hypothetical protein
MFNYTCIYNIFICVLDFLLVSILHEAGNMSENACFYLQFWEKRVVRVFFLINVNEER